MKAVVVGAGAAGTAAALALREGGAKVTVIDGAAGATGTCSGAWDIASVNFESPLGKKSLADRVRAIADARPAHPYARVPKPVELVHRVHESFFGWIGGYGRVDLSSRGHRVATDRGAIRRVASIANSVLDLDRSPSGLVAVAAFEGYRQVDGGFLARSLSEDPDADGLSFVDVPVEFLNRRSDSLMWPHEVASLGDARDARQRLSAVLRRALPQTDSHVWLVPPLLGIETQDVARSLAADLGSDIGEVAQAGAGPQGIRLARRLSAARSRAEVEDVVSRALAVSSEGVRLSGGDVIEADAVVLATGSALAGGLVAHGEALQEPITETPVACGEFGTLVAPGAGFSAGVAWDESFRLLGADGSRVRDSLFVCGSLLEGVSHADGTGLGCAVTTGWLAGESALGR